MNYRHLWLENGASTLSMAIKVTCLRFTCRLLPTLRHMRVGRYSTRIMVCLNVTLTSLAVHPIVWSNNFCTLYLSSSYIWLFEISLATRLIAHCTTCLSASFADAHNWYNGAVWPSAYLGYNPPLRKIPC